MLTIETHLLELAKRTGQPQHCLPTHTAVTCQPGVAQRRDRQKLRARVRNGQRLQRLICNPFERLTCLTKLEVQGCITYDRARWLEEAHAFGKQRFGDSTNTADEQRKALHALVSCARANQLDGHPLQHLHFWDFLQGRARMRVNKAVGADGVPSEVYKCLPFICLLHIYELFEKRVRFEDGENSSPFWKMLEFVGIPKANRPSRLDQLRWVCKTPVLQKWFMSSLRPVLFRSRSSKLHSYGFKKKCSTTMVTGLVRQLLYVSSKWGKQLLISCQDVETAFDALRHKLIREALLARGITPHAAATFLRELTGIKACITLPPAGTSNIFDYSKGGKQGAIETPDIWNLVMDHLLEPVIVSWEDRRLGFELDSGVLISHAVWCDNIILFAADVAMLKIMIEDDTSALGNAHLYWKPSSLEILPSRDSTVGELAVSQRGSTCTYKVVSRLLLLGEMFDNTGDTETSASYRRSLADSTFYKHVMLLRSKAPMKQRMRAWVVAPAASAIWGAATWHVTESLLRSFASWELAHLRYVFRLRRRADEGNMEYNQRTAARIRGWFNTLQLSLIHHRILRSIYKSAWLEAHTPFNQAPLRSARLFHDEEWW